jgi:hypothetical protein
VVDTAPLPPKPVREKGYAVQDAQLWWVDLSHEQTPELRWPFSIDVFDRMRRQDAQVSSVLRAVTSPILRTQWRIDGTGCDPEVTQFVADNLGLPIAGAPDTDEPAVRLRGRDRFSWDQHLRLALLFLSFGHMYFEQVYRWDESTGRFRLRKLGPRMPRTISMVNVARDGGLVSIEQFGTITGDPGVTLPVNRLVAYVLEKEGGNWLGQSLLRSAYKNWLLKDRALRTWSTAIDRQGMGVPIYTGAEKETSLDAGQEIATNARSGDNAGAAIPYGATFELKGVDGTLPDPDKFVRYQDEQIGRSVLAHVLNLGTQSGGQVGSYNLGSVLSSTMNLSLEEVAGLVADTGSVHIVEDLVDINFGSSVPAPLIVFDPIGVRQSELDRVREATGLTSDADLVKFLRAIPNQEVA